MKTFKKVFAFMLAAIMVLAMTCTAFAAEGTGNITISNPTKDCTYDAYKIFDANPSGSTSIAYTATAAQVEEFNKLADVPFTFTENVEGTYNVSKKDGVADQAVIDFFYTTDSEGKKVVNTALLTQIGAQKVNTESLELAEDAAVNATLTFNNVPYGYYLITSSLGAVVTIDSTNTNVTVVDKNQSGPTWDGDGKTIVTTTGDTETLLTSNSANYGDTVDFRISVNTTNYDGADPINFYYVKDQLDTGLSYVMENGAVKAVVKVGDQILTAGTDYTFTAVPAEGKATGFNIVIPWAGKYASPNKITVDYSATLDKGADIETGNNDGDGFKNTANFTYTTGTGTTPSNDPPYTDTNTKTTHTYTYALAIQKLDGKTGTALAGAEFTIAGLNATGENGVYEYDTNGTVTTFVTNNSGQIIIKGVKAGDYVVTETKAPAGYNVLNGTVTVSAVMSKETVYTKTETVYYNAKGEVITKEEYDSLTEDKKGTAPDGGLTKVEYTVPVTSIIVPNLAGTELPSTGGIGTTIFYVVGGLLVAGAGILLVTRKRMSRV